jgi:hypothetical protein
MKPKGGPNNKYSDWLAEMKLRSEKNRISIAAAAVVI